MITCFISCMDFFACFYHLQFCVKLYAVCSIDRQIQYILVYFYCLWIFVERRGLERLILQTTLHESFTNHLEIR